MGVIGCRGYLQLESEKGKDIERREDPVETVPMQERIYRPGSGALQYADGGRLIKAIKLNPLRQSVGDIVSRFL